MTRLQDVREEFDSGRISREDFWRTMQGRHLALREYQQLMDGGELASIEIVADELRVTTSAGVRMVWHPEDLRTAPDVLVNTGTYEPVESAALMQAAAGAHVIFDVGANIGYYSLHWTKVLAEGGSVHAFEPVPSTYERLVRNAALNGLEEIVRANNFGLGEEATTLTIYQPAFSGSSASSIRNLHPDEQSVEVQARIETLDSYFRDAGLDRLDMMKVDVEGAELLVLKGGMATIADHKPLLFMELLRKWSKPFGYHPNDVIRLLGDVGYACFSHDEGRLERFTEMTDETVQTNFFFADPGRHADWLQSNGISAG